MNYKALQEVDRNREFDYIPARTQRKLDLKNLQCEKSSNVSNLPRIPRKRKQDEPGPSSKC